NLLALGNPAAITAARSPSRLCGLQVRRTISSMHPSLRDQVVRYGLAVEPMPTTRPSQLLIETARALATAEAMLVSCVNVCAANLAQNGGRRRIIRQAQSLRCQPRGKAVVGSVAHSLGSINLKNTAQSEILRYQQSLFLTPSSEKQ